MKTIQKRKRAAAGRRHTSKKKIKIAVSAKEFLRHTFYFLKAEQFLKASNRLLCKAA